ncbi:EAL domain-containing protein [Ferrigenium kumadai]|uniref:EAL domain-containing protein n=1 Tax=Ferrigenium kumadai TaxID=1682490 RepID=UPI001FE55520|nr:EAL domain-containing protein [Ferrigenium kumadai]
MHTQPSLLAEIGIDDDEITQRQAFLSFDEHDAAMLQSLHGILEGQRERLIEAFYDHLQLFPEIRPLLGDEAKLARMKQSQMTYFSQLTEGRYDRAYVENRLHIGVVHQRVGLTPKWYMSAYCKYLSEVMPLVLEHHADSPRLALDACRALLKVVFFDMGLALDTYFHAEHKALTLARSYTEQIVSSMPIGFIVLDAQSRIRLVNNAVLQMFELTGNESWRNRTLGAFLDVPALDEKIVKVITSGKHCNEHGFDRPIGGKMRSFLADISLAHMGEEHVVLFMVQDITIRKQSEEEIHRLAFYDALTQLPNRRLLHERLLQSMAISARSGKHGAVMFIDLDNFKTLNDTQGHDVGDLLLKEVARRLTRNVREGDTVARLGGDEFVVALESLSGVEQDAAAQAELIAEKIRAELVQPYRLKDIEHQSSPSIGVCLFRGHQNSLDEVLKQADLAMYQAKSSGRNMVCFFDPEMQAEMEQRAELEKDLRASIRLNQLMLYYQMQVDESGRIVGAEALIRWRHPRRGMVSPAEFIPLAEEIGMIIPIGDWVIEQACAQLKRWEMEPAMRKICLSVNVSPRQLSQPWFVEQVKDAIEKTGIRASRLKLELTESFVLDDVEEAIEKMQELRDIGIRFAMDDFGTGYSSLAYLKRLPLEQLKIDQSFVRDIASDKSNAVMVRTIISIANNFGLEIVAEGVETDDQFAFLIQYGCNRFQGYMFGRPVPPDEFERLCKPSGEPQT